LRKSLLNHSSRTASISAPFKMQVCAALRAGNSDM
jgi:hypothetical protein